MMLGTGNPIARDIYAQLGFRTWYGITMCRPAEAYASAPIRYGDATTVRPAGWSDLGAIVRFIIEPQQQEVVDHFEGLTREDGLLAQSRTNSTGKALLTRADRPGHAMWALVNGENHVQGLASVFRPSGMGEREKALQLCVHPACRVAGVELVRVAAQWARGRAATRVTAYTGRSDEASIECLTACGFRSAEGDSPDASVGKFALDTDRPDS
jgi:hypothetical protein